MMETYQPYQPNLFDHAELATPTGLERYESAAWQVSDLFDNIPFLISGTVLEPCSGNGMITQALRGRGLTVITNEIDPRLEVDTHFDACDPRAAWQEVDWVITNPPFSLSVPILLNSIPHARLGVIFQLRISFAEPTIERDRLFAKYKPNGMIVLTRYSFHEGSTGTDTATTAWFCWLTGNPPLYEGALDDHGNGYAVFSKRAEFFRIARRHVL